MAASPRSDYRVVLCPDFIEANKRRGIFRSSELDILSGIDGTLETVEVNDEKLGKIQFFYKSSAIKQHGIPIQDTQSRPLLRVDGVVTRPRPHDAALTKLEAEDLIEQSRPEISAAFDQFWKSDGPSSNHLSNPREIIITPPRPQPTGGVPKPETSEVHANRPWPALNIVLVLVACLAIAWASYQHWIELPSRQDALKKAQDHILQLEDDVKQKNAQILALERAMKTSSERIATIEQELLELRQRLDAIPR